LIFNIFLRNGIKDRQMGSYFKKSARISIKSIFEHTKLQESEKNSHERKIKNFKKNHSLNATNAGLLDSGTRTARKKPCLWGACGEGVQVRAGLNQAREC
jgi:hypothetical protein